MVDPRLREYDIKLSVIPYTGRVSHFSNHFLSWRWMQSISTNTSSITTYSSVCIYFTLFSPKRDWPDISDNDHDPTICEIVAKTYPSEVYFEIYSSSILITPGWMSWKRTISLDRATEARFIIDLERLSFQSRVSTDQSANGTLSSLSIPTDIAPYGGRTNGMTILMPRISRIICSLRIISSCAWTIPTDTKLECVMEWLQISCHSS